MNKKTQLEPSSRDWSPHGVCETLVEDGGVHCSGQGLGSTGRPLFLFGYLIVVVLSVGVTPGSSPESCSSYPTPEVLVGLCAPRLEEP